MFFKKHLPKILTACLVFVVGVALALQETPVPSGVYVAGTRYSADMYARSGGMGATDHGISVHAVPSALSGSATLTVTIQGKDAAGNYYDVISSTPAQATVTTQHLYVRPGITAAANVSAAAGLPPVFRIKHVVEGTGTPTYAIHVDRLN